MRCTAVMRNGSQCPGEALDGLPSCPRHQAMQVRRENRAFHRRRLSREDREALPEAAAMVGLRAELALLRLLMRRLARDGDVEAFRLALDLLVHAMKTQRDLDHMTSRDANLERLLHKLVLELEPES